MKLHIEYQENYSRLELLARSFFGIIYIVLPHVILISLYSVYVGVMIIYGFFSALLTEKYPKPVFDAIVGYMRWSLRINASLENLVDGYPPFGPNAKWDKVDLLIKYPEIITRKRLLYSFFVSFFILMPHWFVLYVRSLAGLIISYITFFAVLFTGKYPQELHEFMVGNLRYQTRIYFYSLALYFKYPEFTGYPTETDEMHLE